MTGGVDSAVTTYLAARALGVDNVIGVRLPYRTSSPESLQHAELVIDALGIEGRTIDISEAVDGYLNNEADANAGRRGNVMARTRMIALFDQSARYRALPVGTGNKTERLFGYFTWHADNSPRRMRFAVVSPLRGANWQSAMVSGRIGSLGMLSKVGHIPRSINSEFRFPLHAALRIW